MNQLNNNWITINSISLFLIVISKQKLSYYIFKPFCFKKRDWDISIPAKDKSEQLYEDTNKGSV